MLSGCPRSHVDAQAREAMRLARFADRGMWPRTGGLERQRQRDVRLIEMAWAEQANALATDDE